MDFESWNAQSYGFLLMCDSLVYLFSNFLALIHDLSQFGVVLLSFFALFFSFAFSSVGMVFVFLLGGGGWCLCEVMIVLDYRHVRLWLSSSWLVF